MSRADDSPRAVRRPRRVVRLDRGDRDAAASLARLGLYSVALLAALAALRPLLQDGLWWLAAGGGALVPLVAVAVAAGLGVRSRWRLPVAVLAGIAVLVVGFARDVALVGVIPTPEVVRRWGDLVAAGTRDVASQRVPAEATEGILFLVVVLAVAAAVAGAPFLDHAPALAVPPLLAVLAVPVVTRPGVTEAVWPVLVLLAVLALLRVGRRRAAATGVASVAVLAVVGALALPAALPEGNDPVGSLGGGVALNPIIALGEDLRRDSVETALTYRTDSAAGVYLRLATLDEFDGVTWEPDDGVDASVPLDAAPAARGLGADVAAVPASVAVRILDVSGRWLPLPYPATSVEGLRGGWRWVPEGLTLAADGASLRGQEYVAEFLDVEPTPEQLGQAGVPAVPAGFLRLPDEVPPIIEQTARDVVGDAATPVEAAVRLQRFFTGGDFAYSLEAPVEGDYDGAGVDVIARFLEERSGYCVHFASAMAVMARSVGVPARVVVGFQPGEPLEGEAGAFEVLSSDLHAWPEIFVNGVGWLRFEPTPGRGVAPGYAPPEVVDEVEVPDVEAPEVSAPPRDPAEPSTAPGEVPGVEVPQASDEASSRERETPVGTVIGVFGLVGLALLALPATVRLARRARRLRRAEDGDPAAAWAEIRDTAIDHGIDAPASESPRALADRLVSVGGAAVDAQDPDPAALGALRADVELRAYGPPGAPAIRAADIRAASRVIAATVSWRARVVAAVFPASLVPEAGRRARDAGARD